MANRYIAMINGLFTQVQALVTSAGAGDAGKIVATDAAGKLDASLMPTGVGADTASIVSSENLAAGDLVNVFDSSGTPKVRKADAILRTQVSPRAQRPRPLVRLSNASASRPLQPI
jgi:hypothetical protein